MRKVSAIVGMLVFIASVTAVLAHGGGLDSNGGHHNRRTGEYHCHREPCFSNARAAAARTTPQPIPTLRPGTYARCEDVPNNRLRIDRLGRVAVPRSLVPSQPDGDGDGFACGGQLEHKRQLLTHTPMPHATATPYPIAKPTATPRPTPTRVVTKKPSAANQTSAPTTAQSVVFDVPRRASEGVRYTPTNEMYGACRARFPYTHLEDCNVDYDWLMMFWLTRA